jgi:hypothetical protein
MDATKCYIEFGKEKCRLLKIFNNGMILVCDDNGKKSIFKETGYIAIKNKELNRELSVYCEDGQIKSGTIKDDRNFSNITIIIPNNNFSSGELNGRISNITIDGNYYYSFDGHIRGDIIVKGFAKIKYQSGDIYDGHILNNLYSGYGIYTYANGTIYEGNFVDGKFSGHGIYKYPCGTIYEGNFVDDKFSGNGTITFPDKTIYIGTFFGDSIIL